MARSFKRTNNRRVELIHKKYQEGLIPKEEKELARVSEWVDKWVNKRHPLPKVDIPDQRVASMIQVMTKSKHGGMV